MLSFELQSIDLWNISKLLLLVQDVMEINYELCIDSFVMIYLLAE